MKTTLMLMLGVAVAALISDGCRAGNAHGGTSPADGTPHHYTVTVDFQAFYQQTSVRLTVNGSEKFAGIVTTNESTGFAKSVTADTDSADCEIRIESNGLSRSFNVKLDKGAFIGIHRSAQGNLTLEQSSRAFVYD